MTNYNIVFAKADIADIQFNGENLTADFREVPLKVICEKIEKDKGIWFKGDESLFNKKISANFKDIPLAESLKRVLHSMNYSLVFDGEKTIGVYVFGHNKGINEKQHDDKADSARLSEEASENLKIVRNCPVPGGKIELSEEIKDNLKIVRNCPRPGGQVELPDEVRENMKIIRNCLPPGDTELIENR
ncbi:MAG: hypothetical protein GY750_16235 [Lentisphaerae bacterium]|nr:hypothetical protein [Lentisphaerota bacterium]